MRFRVIAACVALLLCGFVRAADPAPADADAQVRARAGFLSAVTIYQGQFDSVVGFCKPHVPDWMSRRTVDDWNARNAEMIEFKDRDLERFIELARSRGAPQEKLDAFRASTAKTYRSAADGDLLYRNIRNDPDLAKACAKLLGTMLSDSMKLSRIAPDAWAYYQTARAKEHD